jgi:hypothetical protein
MPSRKSKHASNYINNKQYLKDLEDAVDIRTDEEKEQDAVFDLNDYDDDDDDTESYMD